MLGRPSLTAMTAGLDHLLSRDFGHVLTFSGFTLVVEDTTLVQIALPIILLPAYAMMPWLAPLARRSRSIEDAKALFAKIHANGHLDDPLVAFELQETVEAITAEKKLRASRLFSSQRRTAGEPASC